MRRIGRRRRNWRGRGSCRKSLRIFSNPIGGSRLIRWFGRRFRKLQTGHGREIRSISSLGRNRLFITFTRAARRRNMVCYGGVFLVLFGRVLRRRGGEAVTDKRA